MSAGQHRWVRVGAFDNRVEAETARSALSARGIASRLDGDDGFGQGVSLSLEHQGMEVLVAPDDLASAQQVLDLPVEPPADKPVSRVTSLLTAAGILLVAILIAVTIVD